MINLRTVIAALVFGFFAGWLYKAIQQEGEEWKAHQAIVNDPEINAFRAARQRMIQADKWADEIEETL
jgi:hypothetical protein